MKHQPFYVSLIMCLQKSGLTDREFARMAEISPSTLSSWKLGRNFPPINGLEKLLKGFTNWPAFQKKLIESYLINSAPEGYESRVTEILKEHSIVASTEPQETGQTVVDEELEAALLRLSSLSGRKKHIKDLLNIVGQSIMDS